uniref:Uncharacterized protein n=1 Tax=Setaria italica TaxID=4555 RepID=K3XNZ3_SETIT
MCGRSDRRPGPPAEARCERSADGWTGTGCGSGARDERNADGFAGAAAGGGHMRQGGARTASPGPAAAWSATDE